MEKTRIPMKRMLVGGWYEDASGKIFNQPFLVVQASKGPLYVAALEGEAAPRVIVWRSSLHGKLLLAEVPSSSEIAALCAKFNAITTVRRERAIANHPEFIEAEELIVLVPDPNHPCGVSVLNLHYDPETKIAVSRPDTTISTATALAKAEWQKNYPHTWVVICEPTDHNTMTFKCPRCGAIHEHGLLDGPRASHCSGIDSDYIVIARR